MTRLQKKCVVGAAGTHLLIIVALFCSGFIKPSPKVDQADILTAIPPNIVENALNTGVQNAPPPTPAPPQPPTPPTPPTPVPTPPAPTVTQPPVPVPPPIARPVQPVQPVEPPPDKTEVTPEPVKPPKPKPAPPKVQVDLTVVHRNSQDADKAAQQQLEAERKARQEAKARQKAINDAMRNIENHSSLSTEVAVPGNSAAAVANYASVVKTVYYQAWETPSDAKNDQANVKVKVVIQSDGSVSSARIVDRSGDSSLDESVQHALDRVSSLEPFPEGMTEKEHTYIINFNLTAKQQSE